MKKNIFSFLIFILSLVLFGAASPALAIATPAKAISSPVTFSAYFPYNKADMSGIKVYLLDYLKKLSESPTNNIVLPSKAYGLGVWQDKTGGRLLVSVNGNSKLLYYKLTAIGTPVDPLKPTQELPIVANGTSLTGVAIASDGGRAYLADAGNGRIYYFDYDAGSDTWSQKGFFNTAFGAFDIALTPVKNGTYTIYVSQKASPGKILAYTFNNGTIAPLGSLDNLAWPTFLKLNIDGTRLYAAVNGANGGDVKIFETTGAAPGLTLKSTVSSVPGIGWTGFDITINEHYLFFTQQTDEQRTNIYRIPLTFPLNGDIKAGSPDLVDTFLANGDNVISSLDYRCLGVSDSSTGNVKVFQNLDSKGDLIYNHTPSISLSSIKQYKLDGVTEIPGGGRTNENKVILKFDVEDPDDQVIYVNIRYYPDKDPLPNYVTLPITTVAGPKSTVTLTLPADGGLADGEYSWEYSLQDPISRLDPKPLDGGYSGWRRPSFIVAQAGAAPSLVSITPNSGIIGQTVDITSLAGAYFVNDPATKVKLTLNGQPDIIASKVTVVSSTKITCSFDLTGAQAGQWDVVETNWDGQSATLPKGFTVVDQNLVTISSLTIARDADTLGSSVKVGWETTPAAHSPVKIYATKSGTFSIDPADWAEIVNPTISQNGNLDTYADANQVGNGVAKYYKILPANTPLTGDLLKTDVVGKFDLQLTEGFNFISVPLLTSSTAIDPILGNQLSGGVIPPLADKIYKYKQDKTGFEQAWLNSADNKWYDPDSGNVSSMTISSDLGYWIELAAGHASENVSIVGSVSSVARGPLSITNGFNLMGSAFPVAVTIENGGIKQSGATANIIPPLACKIYSFKADKTGFEQAWLNSADNKWYDPDSGNVSSMMLVPGKAYWIEEPNGFNWNYPKPF